MTTSDLAKPANRPRNAVAIVHRVVLSLAGGYLFTWGFIALGAMALFGVGMELSEARNLVFMLGILVFLAAFCWAFICQSLMKIWLVLVGGGGAMTLIGWLLSRALTP